jgi:methyl-accepting chemotaxis protein
LLISDSVDKVHEGSNLGEQAGVTMAEAVESVRRVTDIMGEITAASVEQSAGIAQVSQTIVEMDQAARLARAVGVFKLDQAVAQESSLAQGEARLAAPGNHHHNSSFLRRHT